MAYLSTGNALTALMGFNINEDPWKNFIFLAPAVFEGGRV